MNSSLNHCEAHSHSAFIFISKQQQQQQQQQQHHHSSFSPTKHKTWTSSSFHTNSKTNQNQNNNNNNNNGSIRLNMIDRSMKNEFSRCYQSDIILGSSSSSSRKRSYDVFIEANKEERIALSKRFNLADISKLQANVSLQRESSSSNHRTTANQDCIIVEGNIMANVKQTCVRTNEDFDVELDFKIFAAVRPFRPTPNNNKNNNNNNNNDDDNTNDEINTNKKNNRKKKHRQNQKHQHQLTKKNLDEYGMKQLEQLLQEYNIEDDIIEDAAVMGTVGNNNEDDDDGMIDIGELVSQLFLLKLDPYPKKPGTEPINLSFTF